VDDKQARQIFKEIEKNKKHIVSFAKELICIPTVNPPGENYEKIVSVLKRKLLSLGFQAKEIRVPKKQLRRLKINYGSERINLLANWDTNAKKALHLNGHYDVVPVTSNWTMQPFNALVKQNKLYGRGAEDMKSTIAAMIFAAQTLKKLNIKPKVNIEFSFTPDEETGGYPGVGFLVKNNFIRPDYFIGEGYPEEYVTFGNKGMLWLEVEVKGKSAHASMPYLGKNSFEKMLVVANQLEKLKKKVESKKTRFETKDKRDMSASMVMGGILEGGSKVNIIPDRSIFSIDRRLLPEETVAKAKKEITDEIAKLKRKDPSLRVDVKVTAHEEPTVTVNSEKFRKAFTKAIKAVFKKQAKFVLMTGGTDSRFAMRKGIPSFGYSANGDETCHGDDEFVYVNSIIDTCKVYALVMANLE